MSRLIDKITPQKHTLILYLKLFRNAFRILIENHPVKFASAFAYFSLFGLPSIFIIIVLVLGFMFNTSDLLEQLINQLSSVIGPESATLLVTITRNYMEEASQDVWSLVVYVITIFLLATQLMVFFQDILNDLWQIKPNFKNIWKKLLMERGLTFLMVLVTGLLFFASVAIDWAIGLTTTIFGRQDINPIGISGAIVDIFTVLLVFFWFSILFKLLPFIRIRWEPTMVGAAISTILFYLGMWLLWEFVVVENSLRDLYGYVAPIVLVSFWIFYNALAFFYGAALIKVYAEMRGKKIEPKPFAYRFKVVAEGSDLQEK
jgi:membrane protein